MTTVAISQPMLFPWPGFFELVAMADIFVHLDDAQFSKGSFTNRIQVKVPGGRTWMTIPLAGKGTFQKIMDLTTPDEDWRGSHRDLLRQSLAEAPHLEEALALFDRCYARPKVCDLLIDSVEETARHLGLEKPVEFRRASELRIEGKSWRRVLDIVRALGGTRYVTAHGAAGYLDHAAFETEGVEVFYADYGLTPYPQQHGDFTPYVTILDLIGMTGPAAASYLKTRSIPWRAFIEREQGTATPQ